MLSCWYRNSNCGDDTRDKTFIRLSYFHYENLPTIRQHFYIESGPMKFIFIVAWCSFLSCVEFQYIFIMLKSKLSMQIILMRFQMWDHDDITKCLLFPSVRRNMSLSIFLQLVIIEVEQFTVLQGLLFLSLNGKNLTFFLNVMINKFDLGWIVRRFNR